MAGLIHWSRSLVITHIVQLYHAFSGSNSFMLSFFLWLVEAYLYCSDQILEKLRYIRKGLFYIFIYMYEITTLFVIECHNPQRLPFLDSQITSPDTSSSNTPRRARLDDSSGWLGNPNVQSYLLIDYLQRTTITAVLVQGSPAATECWSPTIEIYYSNDGYTFDYREVSDNTIIYLS